ncbi:ADOP family duplicated permease [Acidicapsa dinghuensis]|uniref:ADOP family duplicated permease n=1 Tax=Acidicapsa dinghuensis TaxID=2218256 RepID=A0ABW1EDG4_9BACT|nr:ABC transporter permease [Acidicapsa dinghuensis]
MDWLNRIFRRDRLYAEVSQSIQEHLEEKIEVLMEKGMSREEASRAARLEFGNVTRIEERSREVWQWPKLESVWADLRLALQQFMASPAFTLTALATLALGIGATTAIFSVVNTVLLKPLAYPDPDRLALFFETDGQREFSAVSIPEFHFWQEQSNLFQDLSASDTDSVGLNLAGDHPEVVHGLHVTENYFHLFGAQTVLGRTFTTVEENLNGGRTAVLSYDLWKNHFASDPSILGKSISLGGDPYTVIGVAGQQFQTELGADLWLPLQADPNSTDVTPFFRVVGRLKPGVTLIQANAQLKLAAVNFRRRYPAVNRRMYFVVRPLQDAIVGNSRSSLLLLLGGVGFVLLIACANLASLQLIRASGRKREFAIRASLGASQGRIVRQLLTESVLLSLIGGLLGLGLGELAVRLLLTVSSGDIPRLGVNGSAVGLDWRVLAFTLTLSVLTGLAFGLAPARGASNFDLSTALKESGRAAGTGFHQQRARALLVVGEAALAVVLTVCAALFIRTFIALQSVNPGFSSHNVLTMQMALTGPRFHQTAPVAQLVREARQRINALPGVMNSATTASLPLQAVHRIPVDVLGRPAGSAPNTGSTQWLAVSPGYLSVFEIPLLRGRDFNQNDSGTSPPVVIINQTMGKMFWPRQNPLGQQILLGKGMPPMFADRPREVVGIVGDVLTDGLDATVQPMAIVPQAQVPDGITDISDRMEPIHWVLRTSVEPQQLNASVKEQLLEASGGIPTSETRTMRDIVSRSIALQNFDMQLLSIFSVSALLLAAVGIYGLMAYSVQQRAQEIGVRMALGADREKIRNMVIWQGMRLALAGAVIGVGAALTITHLIATFLFGVKSWDPAVFLTVPMLLSCVALIAVWVPAHRGSRMDPMQTLRAE